MIMKCGLSIKHHPHPRLSEVLSRAGLPVTLPKRTAGFEPASTISQRLVYCSSAINEETIFTGLLFAGKQDVPYLDDYETPQHRGKLIY